ncbi:MAG: ABC transporter ATP-binding protein [Aggregatilineales bacterium]
MTSITLEHISKQFKRNDFSDVNAITAVDDISFKLPAGDVMAILGPSGCGKSTLLRVIAGLIKPDSGTVYYDNVPLEDIPLQDRGIGMVFQEGALVPHWETRRSVGFYMNLRKRDAEVPQRVRDIANITGIGLEKLLDRRPRQLSGGEQQRVSIARALTRDWRVLLFDEPFANLDAKLRTEARIELKRLLNKFPISTVYVTHDQTEAVSLAHRIAVMNAGKFEQIGTYQQLYDSPVNLFVATFIGTPAINLFHGKVEDGVWHGDNFGGYAVRSDLDNGTRVTMGIRPQFMHLKPDGVAGVVEEVIPFLAERYQLVSVWLSKDRWQLALPLETEIEIGTTIYCDLQPEEALYFDTRSGKRIG